MVEAAKEAKENNGHGLFVVLRGLDLLSPIELTQLMVASHAANQKAAPLPLLASSEADPRNRLMDARSYGDRIYNCLKLNKD